MPNLSWRPDRRLTLVGALLGILILSMTAARVITVALAGHGTLLAADQLAMSSGRGFGAFLVATILIALPLAWFAVARFGSYGDIEALASNDSGDVFNLFAEGVVLLRSDGTIALANEAFTRIAGQSRDELRGKRIDSLPWQITSTSLHEPIYPWRRAQKKNASEFGCAAALSASTNSRRRLSINSGPIHSGGKQTGILVAAQELNDFERKNAHLQKLLARHRHSRGELRSRARQQAAVAELGQLALLGGDVAELMRAVVERIGKPLKIDSCSIYEFVGSTGALELRAGVARKTRPGEEHIEDSSVMSDPFAASTSMFDYEPVLPGRPGTVAWNLQTRNSINKEVAGMNVIIRNSQQVYGLIDVRNDKPRRFTSDDLHFLQSVANVLASAIERRRAHQALLEARENLEIKVAERTKELVQANEKLQLEMSERRRLELEAIEISGREQRRIGHDLHDGLGQLLTGIAFLVKGMEQQLAARGMAEAQTAGNVVKLVNQAIAQSRALARGLDPVELEDNGLEAALDELARNTQQLFGVACEYEGVDEFTVDHSTTAAQLYRIAQEAVNNAVKHAKPTKIVISLSNTGDRIQLDVVDDGSGMPESLATPGMGIRIMKYRAHTIGGTLQITAGEEKGARVSCVVPMKA